MEKKQKTKGNHLFMHGGMEKVCRWFSISNSTARRIARSGGNGLSAERMEVYDYMWKNRRVLFMPEFLREFEAEHKTYSTNH